MPSRSTKGRFFATPEEFRAWLERNHASADQLVVGFWKKGTGRPSITWEESVVEALRYGWIDGVRRSLDDDAYTIRFTPRRPNSIWSAKNLKTMRALIDEGRVAPAGLAIYQARNEAKTNRYSFEREHVAFDDAQEREFRKQRKAWDFFQSQPPSYRKPATHWVVSAKKPETRAKRLAQLIADSAAGLRIAQMRRKP
jgi:uncharacterized protein YdeI (YjbR/CyaY-like superfamily)